jgi:serine/threonine-protein kinase ULK/ATG1
LELCDSDFRSYLSKKKTSGGLEEYEVKYWMQQIAGGLKYLNSRNLVHRDLKPGNLLLKKVSSNTKEPEYKQFVIKLADLGFIRQIQEQSPAETICGSWTYMAPEIIKGKPYDMKADLWSLGIIMYKMVCGTSPYKKKYSKRSLKILQEISQLDVKKSLKEHNLKPSGTIDD